MNITCFIKYKIDPSKISQFEQYAKNWGEIIPSCGGKLLGYFLPHEGTNNIAFGLISFENLGRYEEYRSRLQKNPQGKANFEFAFQEKFILEESRSFLKIVPQTFDRFFINEDED